MWAVTLLLLVGVAVATHHDQSPHQHAWETDNEYQYLVRSRTLAGLDKLKEQYTGIQLKGILIIQVKSPEMLLARLSNPQYAHIHKTLMNGPESEISDQQLEYRQMPMSGKPFEIKLKHGVIRDISVDRDVPTWELNILKAMVSQLQIDTQGENAIDSSSNQIPVNENSPVMFKAMEDSVGGRCEVLYDITPLSESVQEIPEKVPFPQYGNGQHYDVKKVKNYQKCQQRQVYHYGVNDPWKRKHNEQDQIVSQLSVSQMIISGNLKRFTIQSSSTKNQISVKPKKSDSFLGTVYTITRLTLVKKGKSFNSNMSGSQESNNLESTGNLVYTYNNPFSNSENRRERRPSISWNSAQVQSSESSSSSQNSHGGSSSSSSSSSEEYDISNMQSKAPLHLAPNVPLLPMFIGYKGKSIQMSEQIDVVPRALQLITQIAEELQLPVNPSATLEKYIMLKNLLRTLNHEQYVQLEQLVLSQKGDSSPAKFKNMQSILRDSVTQAATGPALLTIINWLKTKKVQGIEAARILSQIPKNVHVPTEDYLKTFFELIVDPRVSQQRYVNVSAPLALAELIYNSHVKSRSYPTHSFGPMILKDNNDVTEQYIPYLEKQLKQGFLENNSVKVQTYIMALGRTGHPKIIPIFEPYLENTKPVSKFQRLLMVAWLSTLAKIQPKLVGPIFYKLYFDTREDNEIRALAVHQFITTDPPLITLQRIAKYTNYDQSEDVNSVVASTIQSIALNKKQSGWQDLASKARSVRNLLNTNNRTTSVGYYKDIDNWFFKEFYLQTVAGNDNSVPTFLRLGVNTIFDYLEQPTVEAGYATSNIRQLFYKLDNINWNEWDGENASERPMQKSRVDEIAQALKIKPGRLSQLEGNVYANTPYGFLLYPFDSNTLESIPNQLKNLIKKSDKMELTAFNNYETTISFATELGVPFVYSVESPTVTKYEIEWKKEASSGQKQYGVINAMFANKVEKRFGFVAPFEHQNYLAGIDENQMVQTPVEYEVEYDSNQRNLGLKIRPNLPQTSTDNSQVTLLHCSTVPFTARQNILDLQPVSLDKNTHLIMTSKKQKATTERGMFSMKLEADNQEGEENDWGDNASMLWRMRKLNNNQYKKLEVSMNVQQAVKNEFDLNIVYDSMEVATYNEQQSHGIRAEVFPIDDSQPNSKDRRHQIMKGLSRGLQSGKVHVIDMYYNVPSSQKRQVLSIGVVKSNVDQKSKAYVYFNSQLQKTQEKLNEFCYIQEVQFSPNTPLDLEHMVQNAPSDYFRAELLYGKNCKQGEKVVVVGNATRSNQMQEMIENAKVTKQCREDIQKGNKVSMSCQKAIELAQIRDQYQVSIIDANEFVQKIIYKFIEYLTHILTNVQMKVTSPENSQTNQISVKVNESPFCQMPQVQLLTPQLNVTFPSSVENEMARQMMKPEGDSIFSYETASCTLDKNEIHTFDKKVYHVDKLVTDHVLMITNKQKNPDNHNHAMSVTPDVSIAARDESDGSRVITAHLSNYKIQLVKLNNRLQVIVNDEKLQSNNYQHRENGKGIFEITALPDGSIQLSSDVYEVTVVYDGKRARIWVSNAYRNVVQGLCGNYDSNPHNDFLTPKACILTKPEEFVVTYALTDENSPKSIQESKRRAEQAQCQQLSSEQHYQRNVISDREAGRMLTEDKNWGYHQNNLNRRHGQGHGYNKQSQEGRPDDYQRHNIVHRTRAVEEGNEICFTTRPVPMCREGARPTESKPKMYKLYCLPRNEEESQATKRRVEQGANPDFTRKPVSKSHVFQVPSVCSSA